MRLLLVEDDPLLGDGLRVGLRQAGYAVDWVEDGQTAKFSLQSENYDLAVLDLGLPKIPGLEVLKWLRARAMTLPVLVLTARDTIPDRVTGLDAGADDYLIKPFDLDELIARLRALSRRGSGLAPPPSSHTGRSVSTLLPIRYSKTGRWWNCLHGNFPFYTNSCSTLAGFRPAINWKAASMAGARKWKAIPSRSIFTTCARNWATH